MKFFSLISAFVMTVLLTACGDKGSSGGGNNGANTATPLAAQYYYLNKGQCYDDQDRRAENTQCEGLSGYYDVNGYCYNPSNAKVANEYCQRNPTRVRPSCEGTSWYYMKRGKRFNMDCRDRACRGRNMYDRDGKSFYCRS